MLGAHASLIFSRLCILVLARSPRGLKCGGITSVSFSSGAKNLVCVGLHLRNSSMTVFICHVRSQKPGHYDHTKTAMIVVGGGNTGEAPSATDELLILAATYSL